MRIFDTTVIEPPAPAANGGTVVLIHGILYRGWMMRLAVGNFLARSGYRVVVYDYRTTRDTVRGHGAAFRRRLESIGGSFAIVGHSMGCLVTRAALAEPLGGVEKILMIAPPNRGSRTASFWCREVPCAGRLIRSLPDLRCQEEGTTLTLPVPGGVPLGILTAEYDAKVDFDLTRLDGATAECRCAAGHSSILTDAAARRAMLRFLATGNF